MYNEELLEELSRLEENLDQVFRNVKRDRDEHPEGKIHADDYLYHMRRYRQVHEAWSEVCVKLNIYKVYVPLKEALK